MIQNLCPKNEYERKGRSVPPPISLSTYISSAAHLRSSCHRAIQQKGRSSHAIHLRTRQLRRCSRIKRSGLQTSPLLLAGGARLAVDRRGYLAHPSCIIDGVAGILVNGDHGLAFRADVIRIDWLWLVKWLFGLEEGGPHLHCTKNVVSSTHDSFGSRP